MIKFFKPAYGCILLLSLVLSGCINNEETSFDVTVFRDGNTTTLSTENSDPKKALLLVSGSENRELEFLLEDFCGKNDTAVTIAYMGSLDIMKILAEGGGGYDGVWPANSMWISLGDTSFKVKHTVSIYQTPVVFGIKKSIADSLGFTAHEVSVTDILAAIQAKKFTFCMTSATQSNSGACAYISFLYAFLGNPEMVKSEDLDDPALQRSVSELLKGINRSSGSSDWLKDLFLSSDYDAMVNYETLIISSNKRLKEEGREPLYAVYPKEGVAMADSPLGYINNGNSEKEALFKKLQEYLLSAPVQLEIQKTGRRTGFIPISKENRKVFNADEGIDINKTLSIVKMPDAAAIEKALELYQEKLKKPSLTFYCLDFSGSMAGPGEAQLKEAVRNLLDQDMARRNLLSAGEKDENVFVLFNEGIRQIISISGNDSKDLLGAYNKVDSAKPGGGTDIYTPIVKCFELMQGYNIQDYISSIIVMSDGESEDYFEEFSGFYKTSGMEVLDVPVFSIMFGEANQTQLDGLAELTRARVFDGKTDLIAAFKNAKGYN
ncbi:MAG: VWA domain-containing protein [Spirochaetaceae bacterium]|jgi:Ca-activated chloride channel family protein|nr:VWA domain-containing protein [Spirochaetaceae bacterium]